MLAGSKIIEFLTKNIKLVLFAAMVMFAALYINSCNRNRDLEVAKERQEKMYQNNLMAMNDSITRRINDSNQEVFTKMSLIVDNVEDLKLYNEDLYNELKDEIGDIDTYIKAKLSANLGNNGEREESVILNDSSYVYSLSNKYEDEGISHTWLSETEFYFDVVDDSVVVRRRPANILQNTFKLNIELGTTVDGDTTLVFAKSLSPLVSFDELQSVKIFTPSPLDITPKQYRWGIGPQIGVHYSDKIRPSIGIGLQYNVIRF